MLVTTKKKIYLNTYGIVEVGTEVDISKEIAKQFGAEVFDGLEDVEVEPTTEVEETAEDVEVEPKRRGRKKADNE